MAFRWRTDDGPTLNAGLVAVIFRGSKFSIAKKPYFCDFQGGGVRTICAPPPLWIRTWIAPVKLSVAYPIAF